MREAGEPQEVIDACQDAGKAPPVCLVMPENWPAFEMLVALQTQWDRVGMSGRRYRLIYEAIKPTLEGRPDIAPMEEYPDIFRRLQILERAVLKADEDKE